MSDKVKLETDPAKLAERAETENGNIIVLYGPQLAAAVLAGADILAFNTRRVRSIVGISPKGEAYLEKFMQDGAPTEADMESVYKLICEAVAAGLLVLGVDHEGVVSRMIGREKSTLN